MRFAGRGARKREYITRIALAMGVIGLAGISVAPSRAAAEEIIAGEIIIEATALRPPVLLTELDRRVTFVNRSGQPVHVDFISRDPELHHVFQVMDRIWAVFHRSGRHPFEVHFRNPALADLHGAVEVVTDPYGRPDPLTCSGVSVMGACIER